MKEKNREGNKDQESLIIAIENQTGQDRTEMEKKKRADKNSRTLQRENRRKTDQKRARQNRKGQTRGHFC